jgi:hypothetical protein
MIYAPLVLLCIVFCELFTLLRIGRDALGIVMRSQEAVKVLAASDIADDEKEVLMRRASADMFKLTLRFAAKLVAIALALYLLFELSVLLAPEREGAMIEALFSPIVIVILTITTILYAWARRAILVRQRD